MKAPETILLHGYSFDDEPCKNWTTEPLKHGLWGHAIQYEKYIRKDVVDEMVKSAEDHAFFAGQERLRERLLEWAKNMKRICKGAEPIEKAYQTVIDKIESL